jgi:hypothetical protein
MKQFKCPFCGKPGISVKDKMFLDKTTRHSRTAICRRCGETAHVPTWGAFSAGIPGMILMLCTTPLSFAEDTALMAGLWCAAFFLTGIIFMLWVPLVRE